MSDRRQFRTYVGGRPFGDRHNRDAMRRAQAQADARRPWREELARLDRALAAPRVAASGHAPT